MRPENWKSLNPVEKAELVRKCVKEADKIKAARALNISKDYIDQLLAILKLPAEIQEKLKRKEIGIYDAFRLARSERKAESGRSEEEVRRLKEKLSALEEENRQLKRQLSGNRDVLVVISRLQRIFAPLEKREEELRYLLHGIAFCGAHKTEIFRWISLLQRMKELMENSLATVDANYVDVEKRLE